MISVVIILISLVPMIGTLVSLRFMPDTIPMHYNTFPVIEQDPAAFVRSVECAGLHACVIKIGETITL